MEELILQQKDNTVTFTVKVVPRSSKTAVAGVLGGMLKIKLAAAPEKGKANESLVEFLADTLGVKKNAITITSGLTSPVKTIQIAGISTEYLLDKLNCYRK
ncbi:MAG: DUF167 domain-containing protein [Sedimentisphaerales bacterium]|jgi:uncharacterized protein (TIGR00251 family)